MQEVRSPPLLFLVVLLGLSTARYRPGVCLVASYPMYVPSLLLLPWTTVPNNPDVTTVSKIVELYTEEYETAHRKQKTIHDG